MNNTPDTSKEAYKDILESGDDVSLRKRVAAALATGPMTTKELDDALPESTRNAIRPRVNELIRMGCVEREGKRQNPSGHNAYVNHLTERGYRYLAGTIDPEPTAPVAEHKDNVVEIAREYVRGNTSRDVLQLAVEKHDVAKRRMDPEWDGGVE